MHLDDRSLEASAVQSATGCSRGREPTDSETNSILEPCSGDIGLLQHTATCRNARIFLSAMNRTIRKTKSKRPKTVDPAARSAPTQAWLGMRDGAAADRRVMRVAMVAGAAGGDFGTCAAGRGGRATADDRDAGRRRGRGTGGRPCPPVRAADASLGRRLGRTGHGSAGSQLRRGSGHLLCASRGPGSAGCALALPARAQHPVDGPARCGAAAGACRGTLC